MNAKQLLKDLLALAGYKVSRLTRGVVTGASLWDDLRVIIPQQSPICFDVGANAGQTLDNLLDSLDGPIIHAFEPSTEQFRELNTREFGEGVTLHNCALGDKADTREFINFAGSDLSSFLPFDQAEENRFRHVKEVGREMVSVDTVDNFIQRSGINQLDLLKTDTQGFDLEVLKGAQESLEHGVIRNILIEINFVRMYSGQASHLEILQFLNDHDFQIVDMYEKFRQGPSVAWCTALFSRR